MRSVTHETPQRRSGGSRTVFGRTNACTLPKSRDSMPYAMKLTAYLKRPLIRTLGAALFASMGALAAGAATTQPNGLVVPIVNTGEDAYTVTTYGRHDTLPLFFTSRGETIDYSI